MKVHTLKVDLFGEILVVKLDKNTQGKNTTHFVSRSLVNDKKKKRERELSVIIFNSVCIFTYDFCV